MTFKDAGNGILYFFTNNLQITFLDTNNVDVPLLPRSIVTETIKLTELWLKWKKS